MKVLTKVVIRISDSNILSQEGYEYEGPMAECKGGGGGGAGKIDYPDYMETWHTTQLTDVKDSMDAAILANPWTGETSYDPDTPLATMWCAVCALNTVVDGLDGRVDWHAAMLQAVDSVDSVIDDTYITTDSDAYDAILSDQLTNVDLPKFKAGMSDINAVMSSGFTIGESLLYAFKERNVAKYTGELRARLAELRNKMIHDGTADIIKLMLQKVDFKKAVTAMSMDAKRIQIVAKGEEADQQHSMDENEALWDLETFQYGSNMLAAIGGGVGMPGGNKQPSKMQSALGGAMAGAGAGAAVGGGWGAAAGALIGGIGGYMAAG